LAYHQGRREPNDVGEQADADVYGERPVVGVMAEPFYECVAAQLDRRGETPGSDMLADPEQESEFFQAQRHPEPQKACMIFRMRQIFPKLQ
jgi:hypothetical protein